jgi:hypothetical protein
MITADLVDDAFWCWSMPLTQVRPLLPIEVEPVLCDGRAWVAVAAARMIGMRVAGIPLLRPVVAAVTLAVVTWRADDGRQLVGNYFLDAVTDSRLVAIGDRCFGGGVFGHGGVSFVHDHGGLRLMIPDRVDLWIADHGTVEDVQRQRLEQVFAGNQRGVIYRHGRLLVSDLSKDHWRMDARPVKIGRAPALLGHDAQLECGFDASGVHACWNRLRLLSAAA